MLHAAQTTPEVQEGDPTAVTPAAESTTPQPSPEHTPAPSNAPMIPFPAPTQGTPEVTPQIEASTEVQAPVDLNQSSNLTSSPVEETRAPFIPATPPQPETNVDTTSPEPATPHNDQPPLLTPSSTLPANASMAPALSASLPSPSETQSTAPLIAPTPPSAETPQLLTPPSVESSSPMTSSLPAEASVPSAQPVTPDDTSSSPTTPALPPAALPKSSITTFLSMPSPAAQVNTPAAPQPSAQPEVLEASPSVPEPAAPDAPQSPASPTPEPFSTSIEPGTPSQMAPSTLFPPEEATSEHMPSENSSPDSVQSEPQPTDTNEQTKNLPKDVSDDDLSFGLTPDDNRGNWFEKRKIARQAEQLYEDIRLKVIKLQQYEQPALQKRDEADANVENFFASTGVTHGELEKAAQHLIDMFAIERAEKTQLTEEERELLKQAETNASALDTFKTQLDTLKALDKTVAEAFSRVLQQTNQGLKFEQEAWEFIEQIHKIADHTKAETLLAEIKARKASLEDSISYLDSKLLPAMDAVIAKTKSTIDDITTSLKSLEDKGISLKQTVEDVIQKTAQAQKAEAAQKQRTDTPPPVQESAPQKPEKATSFKETFMQYIHNGISFLRHTGTSILEFIQTHLPKISGGTTKK